MNKKTVRIICWVLAVLMILSVGVVGVTSFPGIMG